MEYRSFGRTGVLVSPLCLGCMNFGWGTSEEDSHRIIHAGKVLYIGTSTYAAWQLVESLWASKELGLNRFVSEQPPYNILDRRIEKELLPMCRTYGFAVIPWSPIAGG